MIGILWLILFIWALFNTLTSHRSLGGKVLWIIICLIFPVVGVLIYFFFGRR
ncbi:MAG TPA: PLDc N-terminal domain-containing protein [Candidatus Nanoarchaeia archaeon]|nr:PLDc N-terminal domain-containing protein [Candidatus Nanoarchaeia archaeon]